MPGKTFFSYSRADAEFTRKLATDLREAGADLWIDQLDIQPGTRWDLEIEKALKEADTLLVVLSPNAVTSNNIMDEISYAIENNKRVIPTLIKQCDIPFRIKRFQYINFEDDYDEGFKRLSAVLNLHPLNAGVTPPRVESPRSVEPPHSVEPHHSAEPHRLVEPSKQGISSVAPLPASKKNRMPVYIAAAVVVIILIIWMLTPDSKPDVPTGSTAMNLTSASGDPSQDSIKSEELNKRAVAEKDCAKAIPLYEESARLGNAEAMHSLAGIYEGNEVDKGEVASLANFDKALYWLRCAVNAKNVEAIYEYGSLLNGSEISTHFSVPAEYINKDSAKYFWDYANENTTGGVKPYATHDSYK